MEREVFERKVECYTRQIQSAPGLYKLRVLTFALFGYAVYALMLLATLGLLVGIVALLVFKPSALFIKLGLKLGIPLLVLVAAMFSSLKVAGYMPVGIPLRAQDAPELFAELDAMRARLSVPKLSRVLLTDDYNASVVQSTRLGFFGSQSTLILGLPLMQAVSREDLRVVVAHELGHLSGNHSKFAGWVYRAVRSYVQLLQSTGSSSLIEGFLNWYVPRLDALSFPLRRQNEYEADAAAAELHGKDRAAQALANINVRAAFLPDFWQSVFKKVTTDAHPPAALFHDWAKGANDDEPQSAREALENALAEKTSTDDTHPSLADRVQALGTTVSVEDWPARSAAQEYFGDKYDYFVQQAGYHWSSHVATSWQQKHAEVCRKKERLAVLEGERQSRLLSADEAFEYADLAEDVLPDEDPLRLFQAVLELHPEHEGARFSVGRLLLARNDAGGVPLLESFQSHRNPELRLASAALLSRFHARNDDEEAAQSSLELAQEAADAQQERERARNELTSGDRFVPHGLGRDTLEQLVLNLALVPEVRVAYLVKKELEDNGPPLYVLAFEGRTGFLASEDALAQVPERLSQMVSLPGEHWVVPLDGNGALRRPIAAVEGSEIYAL